MSEEDNIELKQEFLRNEILDKGFNGQDFMDFLMTKKGEEGVDINNWSLSELREVSQEFQQIASSVSNPQNCPQTQDYEQKPVQEENNQNYPELEQINNPPEIPVVTPNYNQQPIENTEPIIEKTATEINQTGPNKIIEIQCLGPEKSKLSEAGELKITLSL